MLALMQGVKAQQGALALAHLLLAATRMSSEDPNDCIPTFFKALEAFDPDFLSRLKRGEFEGGCEFHRFYDALENDLTAAHDCCTPADGYSDDCSPPKSLAHTIRAYTGFLSMDQAKVGQTLVLRPQIEARLRQLQVLKFLTSGFNVGLRLRVRTRCVFYGGHLGCFPGGPRPEARSGA
jgi:hypothetical protein